jgi:RNA polymerase sigma factor (sigma-70 family)
VIGPAFAAVLAAAQARAPWALEELYRDLAPAVTSYLRLHGAADPDDLASETFVSVLTGLGSFTGEEPDLRAWVFTIAHRRLVDEWRRAARRPRRSDAGEEALAGRVGGNVEHEAMAALGTERVHEVCAGLPPDQRAVVLLRVLGDLTVEEVARVLGRSPAAVKALQRRGLLALSGDPRLSRAPLQSPPAMTGTR